MGKLESKPTYIHLEILVSKAINRCGATRSTLNLMLSETLRQENNCTQIGHIAFKYSNSLHGVMTSFVQYVRQILRSFDG